MSRGSCSATRNSRWLHFCKGWRCHCEGREPYQRSQNGEDSHILQYHAIKHAELKAIDAIISNLALTPPDRRGGQLLALRCVMDVETAASVVVRGFQESIRGERPKYNLCTKFAVFFYIIPHPVPPPTLYPARGGLCLAKAIIPLRGFCVTKNILCRFLLTDYRCNR